VRRADNLNLLEPYRPVQACNGIALPLLLLLLVLVLLPSSSSSSSSLLHWGRRKAEILKMARLY
jgi:hypothetical protein